MYGHVWRLKHPAEIVIQKVQKGQIYVYVDFSWNFYDVEANKARNQNLIKI